MKPRLSYIVCSAPRTGSSLLCSALWRTDRAGRPAEYFDIHAHNEQVWINQLGIAADADYVSKVLAAGCTDNGVFGLKLHWHQARALSAKLLAEQHSSAEPEAEANAKLHAMLSARIGEPRYIWIRRRNHVAQAISYYRAGKTDFWRLMNDGRPPDPKSQVVEFDYDAIDRNVRAVEMFERGWYQFFMAQRLRALIVVYEDFSESYEKTVRGVLSYLGLHDPQLVVPRPQFRKQADGISDEFEQRYRQMRGERREPRRPAVVRKRARPARRPAALAPLPLIAYDLQAGIALPMEPAPSTRPWIDAMPARAAARCLPLMIANQAGWFVRNTHRLSAIWDGTPGLTGVVVTYEEECQKPYAATHFGSGILTFSVGCLFRTPPGYNLHVRGPANWPKDGIAPLEGIVETDWLRATFTMNWKFTRPGHRVMFDVGEPIAMLAPVARGDVERFRPEYQKLAADPEWAAGYQAFSASRSTFNADLRAGRAEAVAAGWQRHYVLGVHIDDAPAPEHQTSLSLVPFADRRNGD